MVEMTIYKWLYTNDYIQMTIWLYDYTQMTIWLYTYDYMTIYKWLYTQYGQKAAPAAHDFA